MDLLIELFSEEIPARMQARAREDLKSLLTNGLVEAGLTYASAGSFSTPRRLVLVVDGLNATSRAVREERKGPNTSAPAAAIEGFLRSTGLTLDQLERRADKKGEVFFAVVEKPGRSAEAIVAEVLESVIRTFPWPKSMRWGSGSLRWVRPLQSIICLMSDEAGSRVVPMSVDGIVAGNTTEGHRFLGAGRFTVHGFDDYALKLKRNFVVLDTAEREPAIWQGAQNLAFAAGMEVVPDARLLTEVAGLVEWPVPLMGRIAEGFLHLPAEVLQTSMREHQKFFSVRARSGRIEGFVTVANTDPVDHGATILKGNQKVLNARLSDAKFFWEKDLRVAKEGMGEWLEGLKAVTFHAKLGSQGDRIRRIEALARDIALLVGADPEQAARAARLAKADLRSAMVGEFPELQGVMGRYYALEAGEAPAVADAARDHWRPKGEGDPAPSDPVSVAVALADKIDTLNGFWAIDEKPTGSKDPFALRRAALGVIRLLIGNGLEVGLAKPIFRAQLWWKLKFPLLGMGEAFKIIHQVWVDLDGFDGTDFQKLISATTLRLSSSEPDVDYDSAIPVLEDALAKTADLLSFFHDRLKVFLRDHGMRHDLFDACLAMPGNDDLTLLEKRADALAVFMKTEDGPNLLQGYKRANTILTQAEQKDGVEYSFGADIKFAETDAERALFAALDVAEAAITPAMQAEDFATAMTAMAALRQPIDAFFTVAQVNADNPITRRNRLNLLHRIRAICSGVADLTKIEG
jgi:glycyl-tRNA synthetase beta chain